MSTLTLRLEAYDSVAKQHIAAAQSQADQRSHREVEPLHLLYQLVEREAVTQSAIERAGVEPTDLLIEAELLLRKMPTVQHAPAYLSPRMLGLLSRAEGEAARLGGTPVSPALLTLACAQETQGFARDVWNACGLSASLMRAALADTANADATGVGATESATNGINRAASRSTKTSSKSVSGNPIEEFGLDLTRRAAQGKLDRVVGRDAEIRRMLQVLARRRDNNPLLVGEPGIGKTSTVHKLALRIAHRDVPKMLLDKRIVALDTGTLVAGATLRGQLEERMRSLLDAIRDASGEVLLFIPDLSALIGKTSGAGELLAAAMARRELRVIAVSTPEALRKAVDEGSPLTRRFVAIPIEPPSDEEAIGILRGTVDRFEVEHGVRIPDPTLLAARRFAKRYVPSTHLPKSALDLIDEAAARVRVEMESVPEALDELKRRLEAIEIQQRALADDTDTNSTRTRAQLQEEAERIAPQIQQMQADWEKALDHAAKARGLKEELAAAKRELEQARGAGDPTRAGELRFGTIPELERQLESEKTTARDTVVRDTVTPQDVADVVATWTGVPVSKMLEEETEKLLRMETHLSARVVGQDRGVTALSKAVRRGRVGLRDPRRPIGSFLFLGPTGVGKTELAKTLAEFLFDDDVSLTRLDMSEFMEKHMVARLLGSPPGYVDSDQGGFLTEAVRQRPYSVLLFDEMEKAHPDVFNILLQVLDDGRLTDSKGRLAHFQDTVIIMTSNVGSHLILDHEGTNEELRDAIEAEIHQHFRPEFLNRIDDVIIFDPLGKPQLADIVEIQLRQVEALLEPRGIGLRVSDAAKARIVELGYEPAFGARPLRRIILKHIQDPLAEAVLRGGYQSGDTVEVDTQSPSDTAKADQQAVFTFTKYSS